MESNPLDVAEVIPREIEKSKIREEILTAEVLRRQELEAEVRRELMIGRAMMRSDGLSLFDSSKPLLQSDLCGLPLQYQNGIGMEEKLSMKIRPQVRSFTVLPSRQRGPVIQRLPEGKNSLQPEVDEGQALLQRGPVIQRLPEGKNSLQPEVDEGQALLPKLTNSNAAGIKRKAETVAIAVGNGIPSISTSKKPRKEWRCALCQLNSTSEQALNDHLRGKKHKAKEALLRAERREMSAKEAVSTGSLYPKDGKSPEENQEVMKNGNAVVLKMQNSEDLMKNCGLLSSKKQQHLKLCSWMCDFEINNEISMEAHLNGEKHMTLLRKNGGAVIAISTVPENVRRVEETIAAKGLKEDVMGHFYSKD